MASFIFIESPGIRFRAQELLLLAQFENTEVILTDEADLKFVESFPYLLKSLKFKLAEASLKQIAIPSLQLSNEAGMQNQKDLEFEIRRKWFIYRGFRWLMALDSRLLNLAVAARHTYKFIKCFFLEKLGARLPSRKTGPEPEAPLPNAFSVPLEAVIKEFTLNSAQESQIIFAPSSVNELIEAQSIKMANFWINPEYLGRNPNLILSCKKNWDPSRWVSLWPEYSLLISEILGTPLPSFPFTFETKRQPKPNPERLLVSDNQAEGRFLFPNGNDLGALENLSQDMTQLRTQLDGTRLPEDWPTLFISLGSGAEPILAPIRRIGNRLRQFSDRFLKVYDETNLSAFWDKFVSSPQKKTILIPSRSLSNWPDLTLLKLSRMLNSQVLAPLEYRPWLLHGEKTYARFTDLFTEKNPTPIDDMPGPVNPLDLRGKKIIYICFADSLAFPAGTTHTILNHLHYLKKRGADLYGLLLSTDILAAEKFYKNPVILAQPFNKFWIIKQDFEHFEDFKNYAIAESNPNRTIKSDTAFLSTMKLSEGIRSELYKLSPDLVFTNYVTTSALALHLAQSFQAPAVCESHDIQSFQLALNRNTVVTDAALQEEYDLLDQYDLVLSVSAEEAEKLEGQLEHARVKFIPQMFRKSKPESKMDLPTSFSEKIEAAQTEFYEAKSKKFISLSRSGRQSLPENSQFDLIYVSSNHPPNVLSLIWFRDRIYRPYLSHRQISVLVVGNIYAGLNLREFDKNFYFAGRAENLEPLYAASRAICLPIIEGAGIGIKTIDALRRPIPSVMTSLALRGFPWSARSLATWDDPQAFAQEVRRVLDDEKYAQTSKQTGNTVFERVFSEDIYFAKMDSALAPLFMRQGKRNG